MAARSPVIEEPARRTPVTHEADVLVVGGGAAGVSAAVAAAREGADVLLVERSNSVGGLATSGLIVLLLTLDDGRGRQAVAGLCQELTERMTRRGAAHHPPREQWGVANAEWIAEAQRWGLVWGHAPHVVRYSVAYDPEAMRQDCIEMLQEAKARLLFHAQGCEPVLDAGRVVAVLFQGRSGRFAVRAKVVVDATGDGDLFAAAGCEHEKETVLPWLWFLVGGVEDPDAAIAAGAGGFKAIGAGRLLLPWGATPKLARRIDATSSEDLSYAELACRARVMEEFERLRREVPGAAHAHLCRIAEQLGITESRRLTGRRVLTRDDADVRFADAVALTGHWTKYGTTYQIPYGSLLARELSNLLVAGRCISVDHRVHHATKEIPACMATGEAAGSAAALAVSLGVEPADLDVAKLQRRLREQGAILEL